MSNYDRFAAFREKFGARLGKDLLGIIFKKAGLKPVDFIEKIDDIRDKVFVYGLTSDFHCDRLHAKYEDERFEWGLVSIFNDLGWGPAARVFHEDRLARKKAKVLALHAEYKQALEQRRDQRHAELTRMQNEIRNVQVEFREFISLK